MPAAPLPHARLELTDRQARRIAIAAQQLSTLPRNGPVNRGHLRRLVGRIGLLQIDSVNVLTRAHLMPAFSRLGAYPVSMLESAAWPQGRASRLFIEAWAHEASLVPVESYPLLGWRRTQQVAGPWRSAAQLLREHPDLFQEVIDVIAAEGPKSAGEVEKILARAASGAVGWWRWSQTKIVCEYLFAIGAIGTSFRRGFERVYDLMERVVPAETFRAPGVPEDEAKRRLVEISARAHGIGTVGDLADYFRLRHDDTKRALLELAEAGTVIPVRVRGWREVAYLHSESTAPRTVRGRALLSPFDPLIFERARTERVFGFRYRIEIYTPEPKRVFGYYVFPLLVGERLVGRFDLKADRLTSRLLVQSSWFEPGEEPGLVADNAAAELIRMAGWLSLESVVVVQRGNLWAALEQALRPRPPAA